jgi:hypothetical protein
MSTHTLFLSVCGTFSLFPVDEFILNVSFLFCFFHSLHRQDISSKKKNDNNSERQTDFN